MPVKSGGCCTVMVDGLGPPGCSIALRRLGACILAASAGTLLFAVVALSHQVLHLLDAMLHQTDWFPEEAELFEQSRHRLRRLGDPARRRDGDRKTRGSNHAEQHEDQHQGRDHLRNAEPVVQHAHCRPEYQCQHQCQHERQDNRCGEVECVQHCEQSQDDQADLPDIRQTTGPDMLRPAYSGPLVVLGRVACPPVTMCRVMRLDHSRISYETERKHRRN